MTHEPESKPMILIVDDTPVNIQVLAEALRGEYRVKVATSAVGAFDVIEKHGVPDLILLDVMMPDMDGYEMCRRLKNDEKTMNIPVIFVTAKNDAVDEERGLRLGAVDYIIKPFHIAVVSARIHNHINLKLKTDLLESHAWLDGLTNIPNRRRFDDALQSEWSRASRNGEPISIVMVDVDYFKQYNDHYGHGSGDVCLKKVAQALTTSISRPTDLAARYGGEEFVVLLPNTDAKGAHAIAEKIRAGVESVKIPHEYSSASQWVTVSAGVSTMMPSTENSATLLLKSADSTLYEAKSIGRNRVCVAT